MKMLTGQTFRNTVVAGPAIDMILFRIAIAVAECDGCIDIAVLIGRETEEIPVTGTSQQIPAQTIQGHRLFPIRILHAYGHILPAVSQQGVHADKFSHDFISAGRKIEYV